MKHFIFTASEGKAPADGSGVKRTVTVYQIVKGTPVEVGHMTAAFQQPAQMVLAILRDQKALPRTAFVHKSHWALREAGIANINQV